MAHALGDERRLDVDVRHRRGVVERLCQLERTLHVLARGLEVALAPVAARTVGEDVRAQDVARKLRPLGDRVRLVEEADRGRDARKLVAADTEPVEDLGAVEVGEGLGLGDRSRAREQVHRLAQLALVHPGPGLSGQETGLELGGSGRGDRGADALELCDCLLVAGAPRREPPRA